MARCSQYMIFARINAVETSEPDWSPDDGLAQNPVPFALNATVYGLTPGKRCVRL